MRSSASRRPTSPTPWTTPGSPTSSLGVFARSAWDVPAGTKDVDVVVYARSYVQVTSFLRDLAAAGVQVDPAAALRSLDRDKLAVVPMPLAEGGVFDAELILPKVPAVDSGVLSRAQVYPYAGAKNGVRVASPEDWALFKAIFFRPNDRAAVEDVLRNVPSVDWGAVMLRLRSVYPDDDPRVSWLRSAVVSHRPKNPRPRRSR